MTLTRSLLSLVVLLALEPSCTQNDDPEGAARLHDAIVQGAGYRSWRRAPGFPSRKPSFTAHSDAVEVFVNVPLGTALDGPDPITSWPEGSIIVKEGYSGDALSIVAVMEKRAGNQWFWAEYNGDAKPLYSGRPDVCIDCHDNRKGYSDWVYSFELPR